MKEFIYNNVTFKVGQTSDENWNMLSKASQTDYFFHLDSFPSCFVIMESNTKERDYINYAANLCKEHTKYRNFHTLKVCYCECSNLRRGDKVGQVVFKNKRKINYVNI